MTASFSGGEIRMSGVGRPYTDQGAGVGYRLIVAKRDDRRLGAEVKCSTMKPLLQILEQLEEIDYEFIRLERIFGG